MKIGSLCSGYGGLDLAVEALTGAETVWFSEFDKHAAKVYSTHWDIPNIGDLTKVDWSSVEPIDILTAGYPCQPFSKAGNRKGTNDSRHIFPYIRNAIADLRPKLVFLENVRGHLSLGFDTVLQDLAEIGYDAKWTLARAAAAGLPHRRERLFIVAYDSILNGHSLLSKNQIRGIPKIDTEVVEQTCGQSINERWAEWMMGLPSGWVTDVDLTINQKFKILGNGVVPQQAYMAYQYLLGLK